MNPFLRRQFQAPLRAQTTLQQPLPCQLVWYHLLPDNCQAPRRQTRQQPYKNSCAPKKRSLPTKTACRQSQGLLLCDSPQQLIRLNLSTPGSQEPLKQFTFHLHGEPVELQICT